MTDKEKIEAELERLKYAFNQDADIASAEDAVGEKIAQAKYELCCTLLDFSHSLPEEPVSEELDDDVDKILEAYDWKYDEIDFFKFAKHFYDKGYFNGHIHDSDRIEHVDGRKVNVSRFRRIAKPLKELVSDELEREIEAYFQGWRKDEDLGLTKPDGWSCVVKDAKQIARHFANWQKGKIMAKAIDGKVLANGMGNPILHLWDKGRHLIDKRVKVIVIKED